MACPFRYKHTPQVRLFAAEWTFTTALATPLLAILIAPQILNKIPHLLSLTQAGAPKPGLPGDAIE
jgi:hypothetical protein